MAYKDIPENLQKAIFALKQDIEAEERLYRPAHLRMYKEQELYYEGVTDIFWNETIGEFGVLSRETDAEGRPFDDPIRNVNIYRAHVESIIAALTASVPIDKYMPEDPDQPNDISTAKTYSAIAELIQLHNDFPVLLIRCMFILYQQGLLFGYNYSHRDRQYGVRQNPLFSIAMEDKSVPTCPECGASLDGADQVQMPDDIISGAPGQEMPVCPDCGQPVEAPQQYTYTEPKLVVSGYEDLEKAREIIEVWGPMNVHFPIQVSDQKSAGYLILETEQDYALMRSIYPDKAKSIPQSSGSTNPYERWVRRDPRTPVESYRSLVTVSRIWLRPWMFERDCVPEAERDELKKTFPNGAYCVFINDEYMEAHDESMDDHWTVTVNPLSRLIHSAPLGRPLLDIQDLTTNAYNVIAQTIEYGIPQTFADPKALNFDAYGKHRARPGDVFPSKSIPSGESLGNFFHSEKAATLSDEVDNFLDRLDQAGQFISGDFPSIFGGASEGGSKTLGEYEQSGARALQRLTLPWKMLTLWKSEMMLKAVKEYADLLREDGADEYVVKPSGNDSYLKLMISVADLQGKVGRVIPESSDQFPVSWPQKVARFFQLLQTNNQQILSSIFIPQNASFIKEIFGIDEMTFPGDDQRDKQLEVIFELLKSEPIQQPQMDPMTGQPVIDPNTGQPIPGEPMPTVQPEIDVDNLQVNIEISKQFLVSDYGRAIKITNPGGYANVVANLKMNAMMGQQQQMQQMQMQQQQAQLGNAPQEAATQNG
jgi:hypothetical protein